MDFSHDQNILNEVGKFVSSLSGAEIAENSKFTLDDIYNTMKSSNKPAAANNTQSTPPAKTRCSAQTLAVTASAVKLKPPTQVVESSAANITNSLSKEDRDSDLINMSAKYDNEMKLFAQFVSDIQLKSFNNNSKIAIKGFLNKIKTCHLELLHSVIKIQSNINSKNEEIVSLQKSLLECQ